MNTLQSFQKNRNAVAFAWASPTLQTAENFLAQQQNLIRAYAAKERFNIILFYSCTCNHLNLDKRLAEWEQLLKFIERNKGKISYLLVLSLNIIHPNLKTAKLMVNELKEQYGVTVKTLVPPGLPTDSVLK